MELLNIRKRFDGVTALDGVSLALAPGRVHGLLGENGAGKTTIMNVLYGLVRADSGEIRVDGAPVAIRSPRDAISRGIGMVHQHFMLAGAMTVLDNVLLGDQRAGRLLNRRAADERLRELAGRLGLEVDPGERIARLSVGQQQRVEILKALYRDVRVLILDEPTAVLTPQETDQLLSAMAHLRDQGRSIIFISHKLREVQRICDEITVLRRGSVVWSGAASATTADELAEQMIGRPGTDLATWVSDPPLRRAGPAPAPRPPPVLRLEQVSALGLIDVSLEIGPEIVGIAGVDGNGQQELAETIVGLRPATRGRIHLAGRDVTALDLPRRGRLGISHIPNDRKHEALVPSMSVAENVALKHHGRRPLSRAGIISWQRIGELAGQLASSFDIRAASIDALVGTLSGGNQQKVVLARELAVVEPKLIVAMNPTRGLDIAAAGFVYEQLLARRAAGCAILLISSELDEVMRLSDRIAVLYRGRLTMSRFPEDDATRIGRLMAGLG